MRAVRKCACAVATFSLSGFSVRSGEACALACNSALSAAGSRGAAVISARPMLSAVPLRGIIEENYTETRTECFQARAGMEAPLDHVPRYPCAFAFHAKAKRTVPIAP